MIKYFSRAPQPPPNQKQHIKYWSLNFSAPVLFYSGWAPLKLHTHILKS